VVARVRLPGRGGPAGDDAGTVGETDADQIAAAILELLDAPPAVPPTLPAWDDCAAARLELYEDLLRHLPAPAR
jgi:hypothetical protein